MMTSSCTTYMKQSRLVVPNTAVSQKAGVKHYHKLRHTLISSIYKQYFSLQMYLENRIHFKGSHTLRHTLSFISVMLSWFCALSRVSDYKHHWSDVLAGYTLGILFAVVMVSYPYFMPIYQAQKIPNLI